MNHPKTSGLVLLISVATTLFAADAQKSMAAADAAAPALRWARQWGTGTEDFGRTIALAPSGRCFTAGSTAGDLAAKNAGKSDALIAAYDADGTRVWAAQIGSAEDDTAMSLALAPEGGLYVAGTTGGKLAAGAAGAADVFVARLDPAGRVVWLRQFGSAANDACAAIKSDRDGDIFVAGTTEGRLGQNQFGGADVFLLKLNPEGGLVWSCQWGTDQPDAGHGLALDAAGNLYVTGGTAGCLQGASHAGDLDLFVSKIDDAGRLQWSRQFGTAAAESGMNLCVDATGCIYVGGSSAGEFAGAQAGEGDAVLLKLSATGELLWKRQFGTKNWDGIHGIALSANGAGNVIVGGCQNWPNCQGFVREFDSKGNELASLTIPTAQAVCGTQIAIAANGDIYQTGGTHGPAFGEYAGKGNDLILVRLNAPATSSPAASVN